MSNIKKEKNQPISVFVRVRPQSKGEISAGSINVVEVRGRELTVRSHASEKYQKNFIFDKVFGQNSKQIDVFKTVAEPTVAEIIAGYNCTVFAYGQTGTGKTYTMAGGSATDTPDIHIPWHEEIHTGIIPRTLAYLFDELRVQQLEYSVRVSYLELYNEEIFDLLSPSEDNTKLKLYDDSTKKGSVIVQGLTEITVASKTEVYKILENGAEKRRTASTLMNAQSSRSHTIFCITVHTKESTIDGEDLLKTGKLNLVDLAGSENVNKSGVTDKRVRETCSINTSLLTLGRCIVALAEHRAHVPYRESKLTRLLRDSLGGRTKTSLIATISPAFCNVDETLNTLDYASRAKHITNKPEMNQRLTKNALLKEYGDEIDRLRRDLQATRLCNGIYLAQENYDEMIKELDIQKEEISEKINMIRALKEDMESKEQLCNELQFTIQIQKEVVQKKEKHIEQLEVQLEKKSAEISSLQIDKEEKEFLIAKHSETEQLLHVTAVKLLNVADVSTSDAEKLHKKLEIIADLNKQNKMIYEQHINEFNSKINTLQDESRNFHTKQEYFYKQMNTLVCEMHTKQKEVKMIFENLIKNFPMLFKTISEQEERDTEGFNEYTKLAYTMKNDITQISEKNSNDMKCYWDTVVLPVISNLLKHIEDQMTTSTLALETCKELIANNTAKCELQVAALLQSLNQSKEDLHSKIDDINYKLIHIYKNNLNSVIEEEILQKEAEKQFTFALQALNLAKQYAASKYALNIHRTRNTLQNLVNTFNETEKCREKLDSFRENVFDHKNIIINNLADTHVSIDATVESEKIKLLGAFSTAETFVNKLDSALSGACHQVQNKYKDFTDTTLNYIESQNMIVKNMTDDHSKMLNVMKSNIENQYEHETHLNQKSDEYFDPLYKNINQTVCESSSCNSQYESYISLELEECRENFKKLFTSHIKEYKPSGVTPVRRRYKYPKIVPQMKSTDVLLEHFHRTGAVIQKNGEKNGRNVIQDQNIMPCVKENFDIDEISSEKEENQKKYFGENICP